MLSDQKNPANSAPKEPNHEYEHYCCPQHLATYIHARVSLRLNQVSGRHNSSGWYLAAMYPSSFLSCFSCVLVVVVNLVRWDLSIFCSCSPCQNIVDASGKIQMGLDGKFPFNSQFFFTNSFFFIYITYLLIRWNSNIPLWRWFYIMEMDLFKNNLAIKPRYTRGYFDFQILII